MAATASSNLSLRRPVMNTWAPSATNSLAVASAIPDVAPVITATLPSSLGIVNSPFCRLWSCCGGWRRDPSCDRGANRHGLSDQSADDLVEGLGLAGLVMEPGASADRGAAEDGSGPEDACGPPVADGEPVHGGAGDGSAAEGSIALILFTPCAVKSERQDEAPLRSLPPV